jgi:hypothetical protein
MKQPTIYYEWESEPDRVEFEYLGFKCLIIRHPTQKHLCGYVLLPRGHPYFGKDYEDIPVSVHGGLTFGAVEGDYYRIGFDCAHIDDFAPGSPSPLHNCGTYRNIRYVTRELKKLCRQLTPEAVLAKELEGR